MTADEMVLLQFYIGSGYHCLNRHTRKKGTDPEKSFLVETLNKGLDKLPSYQGFVRRGAKLPPDIRAQHQVGKVVEYPSFTSTSTAHGFGGQDLFVIFSKSGKPIMSFNDGEKEVLFKTNAKFKVLEVETVGEQKKYVLKEIGSGDEAEGDNLLLEKIKAARAPAGDTKVSPETVISPYDSWKCPLDSKLIPKTVPQTKLPPMK